MLITEKAWDWHVEVTRVCKCKRNKAETRMSSGPGKGQETQSDGSTLVLDLSAAVI